MPPATRHPGHHRIPADPHRVPAPFRAFAVRSDEAEHAWQARAPYGRVHLLRGAGPDAAALVGLAAEGRRRVPVEGFSDIGYATTTPGDLAAAAPGAADLAGGIAEALRLTGVLGHDPAAYRASVATRIDYLACCGAGFHNDVARHWSRCLFWLLALDLADVEFVMPHAGLRLALAPGDLIVFDPAMAHGLCRPADAGQAVAESFEGGDSGDDDGDGSSGAHRHQVFLTGELLLSDAQWAALGAPWLAVEDHAARDALDLLVAEFDERSGGIKRLRALRGGMQRSVCHVGVAGD